MGSKQRIVRILRHLAAGHNNRDRCSDTGCTAAGKSSASVDNIAVFVRTDVHVRCFDYIIQSYNRVYFTETDADETRHADAGHAADRRGSNDRDQVIGIGCLHIKITHRVDPDALAGLRHSTEFCDNDI